ncbi:type II CAAX endopeptidase family protein [uncultured Faecalicoccus sp.]|uniref:CPBP family intramembrane glutamic endopeptidase n=1 Tax=uncultured Faecalicoccus sp. TaxID=1971760 RepID=UPI00260788C8|nr:type II CAAX endopeptidase family protein [uncultured Faecalicoccus sp.]
MKKSTLFDAVKKEFRKVSGLVLVHSTLVLILSMVLVALIFRMEISFSMIMLLSALIPMAITMGMFFLGKAWLKPNLDRRLFSKKLPHFFSYLVILLGVNFYVSFIYQLVINHFDVPTTDISILFTGTVWIDLVILAYTVLIGPVFEELLFRGVILRTLDKYHRTFAILVSSALFGMMHMNLSQGVTTFFIGCVLAYASLKEESMTLPIVLHIVNNLVAVLSVALPVLSIFFSLGLIACFVGMVYLLHRHKDKIPELFKREHCDYPYGKMFFSCWTMIVYLILFVLFGLSF